MSKALDTAALIRNRLLTAPAQGELPTSVDLTHTDVLIYRQTPIITEVATAVANATGCAIVITWEGFQVPDPNSRSPRLVHRYNVSVWSKPILDAGNRPADHVIESIILRMWHWVPGGGHSHGEAKVSNGDMVPHKSYLIYDCEILIPVSL